MAFSTDLHAESIELEADTISYIQEGEIVEANGNVRVNWASNALRAGVLRLEKVRGRLVAGGGLLLTAPDYGVTADSLELFLENETGRFDNVQISLGDRPGGFGGRVVEKDLGQRYVVRDGYYTTCHLREDGNPDWDISSEKIEVQADSHGTMQNGLLRVRGIPVLYVPYMVFPVGDERRSGLLQPNIGHSSVTGAIYYQPYFWAIDKHMDLTTTFGLETSARIGLVNEFRYAPSKDTKGAFQVEYYNEKIRGDAVTDIVSPLFSGRSVPIDRAAISGMHRQRLSPESDFYLDVLAATDDLYFREIDTVEGSREHIDLRRKARYSRSDGGLISRAGFSSYGAEAEFYQDFVRPKDNVGNFIDDASSFTIQKPLELWGERDGEWLGGVAFVAEGSVAEFWREKSTKGQRLDLVTTIEKPIAPGGPVKAKLWGRGRATGYRMDERMPVDILTGNVGTELDEFPSRGVIEAGADVSMGLARDFELDSERWTGMRNVLEPFVSAHRTSGSARGELPLYDGADSIEGRTTGTYGVVSRLLFDERETREHRELARLQLSQTYNFSERVRTDNFSDIDFAALLVPSDRLSLNTLVSYDTDGAIVTGAIASLAWYSDIDEVIAGRGTSLGAAYHYVRDGGLEALEARGTLGLSERVSLGAKVRYDFVGERFIEEAVSARLTSSCDCWAINIAAVNQVNPDEFQFRILVEFGGIGSLGNASGTGLVSTPQDPAERNWRGGW